MAESLQAYPQLLPDCAVGMSDKLDRCLLTSPPQGEMPVEKPYGEATAQLIRVQDLISSACEGAWRC